MITKVDTIEITNNTRAGLLCLPTPTTYRIEFGEGRTFADGNVKVFYLNKWYAAFPKKGTEEISLLAQGTTKKDIHTPLGNAQEICMQWGIPDTTEHGLPDCLDSGPATRCEVTRGAFSRGARADIQGQDVDR